MKECIGADLFFGNGVAAAADFDWRRNKTVSENDDDDDVLETTPADVVAQLGFDPKEFLNKKEGN